MKKILCFVAVFAAVLFSSFAAGVKGFAGNLVSEYESETVNILGTKYDLSNYNLISLGQEADDQLYIYNYSGNDDAFEVLCLYSEDFNQEWIQAAKTPVISSVKMGKKKGYKTPYDLEEKCRRCDDICEIVAIRTKSGREYNYNVYVKNDKLYIEVMPDNYVPEKKGDDW